MRKERGQNLYSLPLLMKSKKRSVKDIKKITRDIDNLIDQLEDLYENRLITKGGAKFLRHWYYITFGGDLPK